MIMKKTIIIAVLLATTVARTFAFTAVAPTGQTVEYSVLSATTVSVAGAHWDNPSEPLGWLQIPATVSDGEQTYQVTEIKLRAFNNNSGLTRITLPEGLTTIGQLAFRNCTALDTIELPSTLTRINAQAFYGTAYWADSNNWSEGLLVIDNYLVETRANVGPEVVVPEGVLGIGGTAFYYRINMLVVDLPSTLRFVGGLAFSDSENLDTVRLHATVPPILAADAMEHVYGLTVQVPCNMLSQYSASEWNAFDMVEAPCDSTDPGPGPGPGPGPEPPVAVDDVIVDGWNVSLQPGGIVVSGLAGKSIGVYDIVGRPCATINCATEVQPVELNATGVYVVASPGLKPKRIFYSR